MGLFSLLKGKANKRKCEVADFVMSGHRHVQVGRESLDLLRKTTNPRTFFGRYEDLVFSLRSLGQSTIEIESDTFKSELQIEFIDRLVEAGKLGLLVSELEKYEAYMTEDSLDYLEWIAEQN